MQSSGEYRVRGVVVHGPTVVNGMWLETGEEFVTVASAWPSLKLSCDFLGPYVPPPRPALKQAPPPPPVPTERCERCGLTLVSDDASRKRHRKHCRERSEVRGAAVSNRPHDDGSITLRIPTWSL